MKKNNFQQVQPILISTIMILVPNRAKQQKDRKHFIRGAIRVRLMKKGKDHSEMELWIKEERITEEREILSV